MIDRVLQPTTPDKSSVDHLTSNSTATNRREKTVTRVLRDISAVGEVRKVWQDWQSHPNADINFYSMVLRERSNIDRPHVIVVEQGDDPKALLVGRIETSRLAFKLGYLTLLRPTVRRLTIPFGAMMGRGSTEDFDAVIREIIDSLRRGEADVAFFEPLDTESPLFNFARTLPDWPCKDYLCSSQSHREMALPDSVNEFQRSLSPKVRKNLKWQAKKLLNDYGGDVRIVTYESCEELDQMIRDVEAIATKTYQRGLGVGFTDNAEMRARLQLEAQNGWLRGFVLYLAGKPCAFWLGTIYRGIFHSNFMGYDPAVSRHSPGMFLVTGVIESLCHNDKSNRPTHLDFGLGDAQYKEVLGTRVWQEAAVYIFAPSAKGLLLNGLKTSIGVVDRICRKALSHSSLLLKVKTYWRRLVNKRLVNSQNVPLKAAGRVEI